MAGGGGSFAARLRALRHPGAFEFDVSEPAQAAALYAWLEDHHIRQLPLGERGPLRAGAPEAIRAYLVECQAPVAIVAHLEAGRHRHVCSWLLGIALAFEYGDKHQEYEQAYRSACPAGTPSVPAKSLIAADDPELKLLAEALQLPVEADSMQTLNSIIKAARKLPRHRPPIVPAVPVAHAPPLPPLPRACGQPKSAGRAQKPTGTAALAPLGEEAFPLGFSLGTEPLDNVARVLRMLHVQRLRAVQDAVNAVTECMQEFTANPKTDTRLGKVGR